MSQFFQKKIFLKATQRDLLDRQAQLDHLQRRSDDLHSCLPGTSPSQPNKTVDRLLDKVHDIEEKISIAIKKGMFHRVCEVLFPILLLLLSLIIFYYYLAMQLKENGL